MFPLISFTIVMQLAYSAFAGGIINEVNNFRARNGKPALTRTYDLSEIACKRVQQIDYSNKFSHDGFYTSRNYFFSKGYSSWGENLASGYYNERYMVNAWSNSSTHKSNMLGNWRYTGVCSQYVNMGGYSTQITVQLFGNK